MGGERISTLGRYDQLARRFPQAYGSGRTTEAEAQWRGWTDEVLEARIDLMKHMANRELALPHPYPSPPHRPPTHVIKINRRGVFKSVVSFSATYAALIFVTTAIGGDKTRWRNRETLSILSTGYDLRSDTLEEILEHTLTEAESQWQLNEPYLSQATEIAMGPLLTPKAREALRVARLPSQPRVSRDGLVTLAAIAQELGIEPRVARATLRGKIDKPQEGWAFASSEVDRIKKLLK